MKIIEYQVGSKPAAPVSIRVNDAFGRPADLSFYDEYKVRLIGSDDEEVDLGNGVLQVTGARSGRFVYAWPTDVTPFEKPGDYLLQLEMSGDGHKDFTTTQPIKVTQVGRGDR